MKKSTKIMVILFCVLVAVAGIVLFCTNRREALPSYALKPYIGDNVLTAQLHQSEHFIIGGDYTEPYDLQIRNLPDADYSGFFAQDVLSYDDYRSFCQKWNLQQKFTDEAKRYLLFVESHDYYFDLEARLAAVEFDQDAATMYYWSTGNAAILGPGWSSFAIIVPTDQQVSSLNTVHLLSMNEYESLVEDEKFFEANGYYPGTD